MNRNEAYVEVQKALQKAIEYHFQIDQIHIYSYEIEIYVNFENFPIAVHALGSVNWTPRVYTYLGEPELYGVYTIEYQEETKEN